MDAVASGAALSLESEVAVTGASGHAGANLARALIDDGQRPRLLVRKDRRAIDGLDAELVPGDVLDPQALGRAFEGCHTVYHLAAKVSIHGDPDGSVHRTNVDGTANVIAACRRAGVRRLVHMSSIAALLPAGPSIELDERATLRRDGAAYDVSKAASERLVLEAADAGLEACIVSPTSVLGPHDHKESRGGRMLRAIAGPKIPAVVDGGFDWVDVRDLARTCMAAAQRGRVGERYIIGGHYASLRELAELVRAHTGRWTPRRRVPVSVARIAAGPMTALALRFGREPLFTREALDFLETFPSRISSDKARNELGHTSRPLAETVNDTLDWSRRAGLR